MCLKYVKPMLNFESFISRNSHLSINSAQFAPGEDLTQNPVTHQYDLMQLEQLGVDVVFMPSEKEAYPPCTQKGVKLQLAVLRATQLLRELVAQHSFAELQLCFLSYSRSFVSTRCTMVRMTHSNVLLCVFWAVRFGRELTLSSCQQCVHQMGLRSLRETHTTAQLIGHMSLCCSSR